MTLYSLSWWDRLISNDRTIDELSLSYSQILIERLFKIRSRNTSITKEIKCGILHFVSCSFILAVNPTLLSSSENKTAIAVGTALSAGSCLIFGLFLDESH